MSIVWPSSVVAKNARVTLLVPPQQHRSGNGAGVQQVTFAQRFVFEFTFPPHVVANGTEAFAAWLMASSDSLVIDIPRSEFGSPSVGTTSQVNTAWTDAGGYILSVKGLENAVAIPRGVPVSIKTGGVWYTYFTAAAAASGTTRNVTLTGLAMVAHAVNDEVRIQAPVVEGFVNNPQYAIDTSLHVNGDAVLTVSPK
jgi:hypothetical protein